MIRTTASRIYIVMYHYVREIKKSKFSTLKGLEFEDFKKQIDYFKKNFNIISNQDFVEILKTKKIPKKKSILLTFDDGYIDHWRYVFPYLRKKKVSGCFYPPVEAIKNNKILEVNKIHFILEKEKNTRKILNNIFYLSKKYFNRDEDSLEISKIDTKSRYDNKETILIKRLLQNHLPKLMREKITKKLFHLILNINEKEFAKKLYINENQIKEMYNNNMSFGSHGYEHIWWNKLDYKSQSDQLNKSLNYFKKIKIFNENFSVCYPYGGFNSDTIKILKKSDLKFALTTSVGNVNKKNIKDTFKLPRYDTNDFKI